ncbi:MAG TPA: hypothetical protein VJN88_05375, partial [Ktedonobacterales bacterium]|nr:hypothetical protein [Ktedonobacterales bacterium]
YGVAPNLGSQYFYDDHWVVSARDSGGHECGIFDYVYDGANHRIRFASYSVLSPSDSRFGHAFPYVQASQAVAQVAQARHIAIMANVSPLLIFFPVSADWSGPAAPHHWIGGGESPENPLWLVSGADGTPYFVGPDMRTHVASDLPIA